MKVRFFLALALLTLSSLSFAQVGSQTDPQYLETLYGPIADVSLNDLAFSSESYSGRGVRVKGRIGMQGISGDSFELSDAGARVTIIPIRRGMNEDQLTSLSGQMVEVTGVFTATTATPRTRRR